MNKKSYGFKIISQVLIVCIISVSSGCTSQYIDSYTRSTGKIIERKIKKQYYKTEASIDDTNPEIFDIEFSHYFFNREKAKQQEIVKRYKRSSKFPEYTMITGMVLAAVGLVAAAITKSEREDQEEDEELSTLAKIALPATLGGFGLMIVGLYSDPYITESKYEKTEKIPPEWHIDTTRPLHEPMKKTQVDVFIESANYHKTFTTNSKGKIQFNVLPLLSERPQKMEIKGVFTDPNKEKKWFTYDISQERIAQYLEDFPRYPSILVARVNPLTRMYRVCDHDQIHLTIQNKGKGHARDVTVVATHSGQVSIQSPIHIGTIIPNEEKDISIPFEVLKLPKTDKEIVRLDIREKLGNDALPVLVEVPLTDANPDLKINTVQFRDGKTGLASGNGNGVLENGETAEIEVEVTNTGNVMAEQVALSLESPEAEVTHNKSTISRIPPGQSRKAKFSLKVPTCYNKQQLSLQFKVTSRSMSCVLPQFAKHTLPTKQMLPNLRHTIRIYDGNKPGTSGNFNGIIENGEQILMEISVRNDGNMDAENVKLQILTHDISLDKTHVDLGWIPANGESKATFAFTMPRIFKQETIHLQTKISHDRQCEGPLEDESKLIVEQITPKLRVDYKISDGGTPNSNGNQNGIAEQGEICEVFYTITNDGNMDAENIILELATPHKDIVIPESRIVVGNLPKRSDPIVSSQLFNIKVHCEPGEYKMKVRVSQNDFDPQDITIPLKVAQVSDIQIVSPEIPPSQIPDISTVNPILEPTPTPTSTPTPTPTGPSYVWQERATISESIRKWITSSKNIAVVIGINNYHHRNIQDLKYAVNDAKAIKEVLLERTEYEIFAELYDAKATKDNIRNVVDELLKHKGIDRIIFFFAGHGETHKSRTNENVGFFLPVDAVPENLFTTSIPMSDVQLWAKSFDAKHVLFVFDACFSGIVGGALRQGRDYHLDFLASHDGRHVITAGTKDDTAREYDNLGHGVLTYFLLQGLREGRADIFPEEGDGVVTLNELAVYLPNLVTNYTRDKQHPQFIDLFGGLGQLFIEIKR